MEEHAIDNVTVQARTVHDEENGESYVVFGFLVDGHFYGFHSVHLEAFNANLDALRRQAAEQADG